ncbi:MAG TPA: OsmC family protein [Candidatus Dormibacteraeota bacterium]
MDRSRLVALQAPIKERYREDAAAARITLRAAGRLDAEDVVCSVETGRALVEAGLHPATGGDGLHACSGDMLLQALVACAGVTLRSVATALELKVAGTVRAEGDLDFRGTLGVDKEAPVGFQAIRLFFDLETDAPPDQVAALVRLTERYCVVFQTLRGGVAVSLSCSAAGSATTPPG